MRQQILLVDDHEALSIALSAWINNLYPQVGVKSVSDGETAVSICRQEFFNLILMDIGLPGMNGLEAIAEIKKINSAIPIIAMTIQEGSIIEGNAYACGADGYISKRTLYSNLTQFLEIYLQNP